MNKFEFNVTSRLKLNTLARTGIISTPHGKINTPAFIVVGTKATVKGLTPEQVEANNAQAILANAYHLYLQPGHKLIESAGGLHKFMNWNKPIFTDSGGFQVLSLGSGINKVIDMVGGESVNVSSIKSAKKKAIINDDGVTFFSHLDGSKHRFDAELSMQIQHALGADICFAFDELTSLIDPYDYQLESLNRTHAWAKRCLLEMDRLQKIHKDRPYQALFGVIQGAQYKDLRKDTAKFMAALPFNGYGIGGAIEKSKIGEIIRWVNEELPEDKPKHMLGISEPNDIFESIENGIDTFDCVSPTRVARNGAAYTYFGRKNIISSKYKNDFSPIIENCSCYACQYYTSAYLHHLLHAHELLASTLMSIHNTHFIIKLVDDIRLSIEDKSYFNFKKTWLNNYYKN